MSDIAIRVDKLSKRYRIGHKQNSYRTLRDVLAPIFNFPLRFSNKFPSRQHDSRQNEMMWALEDISFEVRRGEVVGLIGRNGAGKSTFLKILSRITEPTKGCAKIYGRVGSLLEVGTGFHPELSGRENIYLNAAILGMKRREIERKFDPIVSFAEIEKFIDTPVKHYSSGMYVRLAFAVAAHLDPEILLVDEVLAVGDAQFQKKCLGKMGEVAKQGRTVLFVSHNMPAVLTLCQRAILLDQGKVRLDSNARDAIQTYLDMGTSGVAEKVWLFDEAAGNHIVKLQSVRVYNSSDQVSVFHQITNPINLEMSFWCLKANVRVNPSFHVYNSLGICVFATSNVYDEEQGNLYYDKGFYKCRCIIPGGLLNEGIYRVSAIVVKDLTVDAVNEPDVLTFQIHDDGYGRGDYTAGWIGVIRPKLEWSVVRQGSMV